MRQQMQNNPFGSGMEMDPYNNGFGMGGGFQSPQPPRPMVPTNGSQQHHPPISNVNVADNHISDQNTMSDREVQQFQERLMREEQDQQYKDMINQQQKAERERQEE